jgi:hypothetical protein
VPTKGWTDKVKTFYEYKKGHLFKPVCMSPESRSDELVATSGIRDAIHNIAYDPDTDARQTQRKKVAAVMTSDLLEIIDKYRNNTKHNITLTNEDIIKNTDSEENDNDT